MQQNRCESPAGEVGIGRFDGLEFVDQPSVAFGWSSLDGFAGFAEKLSLIRFLFSFGDAAFGFLVKRLRNGGRASLVSKVAHLYFPLCGTVINLKHVAGFYPACRFDTFAIQTDFSTIDGIGCHRSGFKETGGPKPFINSYGV